jgi:hypothetical protein
VGSLPNYGLRAAAAAALIGIAAPALSQVQEGHETWRCDTPNGTYDSNPAPIWDKTTSISGRINFHKADATGEWGSIARIGFTDSKVREGGCHCNGIKVEGFDGPHAGVVWSMLVDGTPFEFKTARLLDTPITFKISIDPNGVMTVKVGREHVEIHTAKLPHPDRDTLTMSCSGADVSFLNVNPQ